MRSRLGHATKSGSAYGVGTQGSSFVPTQLDSTLHHSGLIHRLGTRRRSALHRSVVESKLALVPRALDRLVRDLAVGEWSATMSATIRDSRDRAAPPDQQHRLATQVHDLASSLAKIIFRTGVGPFRR